MDKKNTMLLTVIAVATLLVAVVGATFAFFAISTTGTKTNATITGTVDPFTPGTIVLDEKDSTLKLKITAADMAEALKGNTTYYATAEEANNSTSLEKFNVANITINGEDEPKADTGVNYYCTANIKATLTVTGEEAGTIQFEDTDEAQLVFYPGNGITLVPGEDAKLTNTIKLSDLVAAEDGISGKVNFEFTGTGESQNAKLEASLSLKNSNVDQSKRLADKQFTVKVDLTDFKCDTKEAE